jgi:hypothetical protein
MKIYILSILLLTLLFSINITAQRIIREKQTETAINNTAEEKTTDINKITKVVAEETEITEEIDIIKEEKEEISVAPTAQATPYVRPTSKERFRRYASNAFGVSAVIGSGIGATFGQISNDPPEWERTAEGFGRRFASNYGEGAIRNTVSYGLSEAFKLDNRFEKSGKKNVGSRIKHVFLASYTTRTKNGNRIPDFPYAVGTFAGSITAAEVWYPNRYSYKDGFREGTISLGTRFGVNLLREFLFPK